MPTEATLTMQQADEHTMPEHDAPAGMNGEAHADEQPPGPSPGKMLREGREAATLSLTEVAEALFLTVHYVKALENDDYGKLPGLTFVKGYCRTYARFLRMDVDAVLAAYEAHLRERQDLVAEQEQDFRIRRRNDQAVLWAIAAGIVLVVALFAGWWMFGRESGQMAAAMPDMIRLEAGWQVQSG